VDLTNRTKAQRRKGPARGGRTNHVTYIMEQDQMKLIEGGERFPDAIDVTYNKRTRGIYLEMWNVSSGAMTEQKAEQVVRAIERAIMKSQAHAEDLAHGEGRFEDHPL